MKLKHFFFSLFMVVPATTWGQIDSAARDNGNIPSHESPSIGRPLLPVNAVIPMDNFFANSHYLFDKWVKGSVVSANNEMISNDNYYFNYDKVSNNLLLTADLKQIIEIDKREFKAFAFKDGNEEFFFEHIALIDNKKFLQVLVETNKYSLYKWTFTKFRRNDNYSNLGVYIDINFYYVVFPDGRLFKKIELKKKSIIKNLFLEPEKLDSYFEAHPYNKVDEELLIDLIKYLNK
ncbi:MAG TPA: hypothetical protein VKR32_07550 [Puia sp.]|nr:hypothetical protein [Puia sp.]